MLLSLIEQIMLFIDTVDLIAISFLYEIADMVSRSETIVYLIVRTENLLLRCCPRCSGKQPRRLIYSEGDYC